MPPRNKTRPSTSILATQWSSLSFASASMTGPTWVVGSRGSPTLSSRAALAGGAERGGDHVVGDLLRQRGGVDDHGVDAAGFGDQWYDRAVLCGKRSVDEPSYLRGARKGNAGGARV